jgi:hypothetical protein
MKFFIPWCRPFGSLTVAAAQSILIVLLLGSAASAGKVNIAVLPFDGAGFDSLELKAIGIRFESMVFSVDSFVVIERQRIDNILKEQGFQRSGCVNTDCAVEIGQLLGVDKIIYGNVTNMAGVIMSDIKIVDVHSGKIDQAIMDNCHTCAKNEYIISRLPTLAAQVSHPARPTLAAQQSALPRKTIAVKPILSIALAPLTNAHKAANVISGVGFVLGGNSELGIEAHIPVSTQSSLIGSLLTYNYHFFLGDYVVVSPGVVSGILGGKLKQDTDYLSTLEEDCHYFAGFSMPLEVGYRFLFVKAEVRTLLGSAPGGDNDRATFYTFGISYYPQRRNN